MKFKEGDRVRILLDGADTGKRGTVGRVYLPRDPIREFTEYEIFRDDGETVRYESLNLEPMG